MARITGRARDRNRFTKKYPFVRVPKKTVLETTETIVIELISLNFNNESTKSQNFELPFDDTDFRILVSPRDTTPNDSANVALNVDSSLTDVSKVTVNASAPFTGIVDVIAIKVIE